MNRGEDYESKSVRPRMLGGREDWDQQDAQAVQSASHFHPCNRGCQRTSHIDLPEPSRPLGGPGPRQHHPSAAPSAKSRCQTYPFMLTCSDCDLRSSAPGVPFEVLRAIALNMGYQGLRSGWKRRRKKMVLADGNRKAGNLPRGSIPGRNHTSNGPCCRHSHPKAPPGGSG